MIREKLYVLNNYISPFPPNPSHSPPLIKSNIKSKIFKNFPNQWLPNLRGGKNYLL